jgi:8-oxo-dGTP pyrophosphatase MutT (NUDIX family)
MNDFTKPIRAGGVLLFNNKKSKIKLLMIKKTYQLMYEDIGGKTSSFDDDIYETISREVSEETNNLINSEIIKKQLCKGKCFYIPHAKYLLIIVKSNSYERKLTDKDFGDKEIHDDINRTIEWINLNDFLENKLNFNPRLHSNELKEYLSECFTD